MHNWLNRLWNWFLDRDAEKWLMNPGRNSPRSIMRLFVLSSDWVSEAGILSYLELQGFSRRSTLSQLEDYTRVKWVVRRADDNGTYYSLTPVGRERFEEALRISKAK